MKCYLCECSLSSGFILADGNIVCATCFYEKVLKMKDKTKTDEEDIYSRRNND